MMENSLQLGYYGKHISQIDVVLSVESNSVVRKGPAQITTVIVDAAGEAPTINVVVTNLGLGSASFTVELGECIPSVKEAIKSSPPSFSGYKSKKLAISPLHQADFSIQLCKGISHEKTRCIVLVQDEDGKTVAARRITIVKDVRCLCAWHCQCNCIHSEVNLKCRLMPQDELLAAGFKGTVPVILPITYEDYLATVLEKKYINCLLLYFILFLILLLLLGVCKVVLGLTYWDEVWVVGIPYYYGPKTMKKYQEESLANCEVQNNMTGYPVHSDSKKRSAHKYNRFAEFLMNIFMFLLLPFVFLIWWPIHMCFIALCKNGAGYQWKFSISKFIAGSNNTSETSSFIPEDTESTQSRSLKEDCLEGTPSKSKSKSKSSDHRTRSTPDIPETDYSETQDHSHITFVTYDGTSDEQELRDIDYVMLQMRKSSSALQKARDRAYCISGSHRIFLAESIDEEDTTRSRSVRDVLTTVDDTLSEVTTKDSLEAVTGSEAGLSSNAAQEFVERLRSKKFIFRNIDKIIGDVNFPKGRAYSIRGYFFNAPGGYKFIPPTPLWQYWTLDEDGETVVQLDPPMNLFASEFEKSYDSAQNVLEEGDLSMLPISTCVNVQYQHFDEVSSRN
ncbi:hypothetical protein J437_LFUL003587 [Ladona fulva]|uniref:Generative cell specific-1/HAP2 domain-containing protein n=1 Tax=Ladona fulva TaxID=123851 RepID=A0A8K0NVA2_LADFU|nr:hypothetical protein J437_LFUL003587 [Ladona fulva]